MLPGSVERFPQIPASVPVLVVQFSGGRKGYVHLNGGLAIDPGPSCPGPVENHLSAHFARYVLPLEGDTLSILRVIRNLSLRPQLFQRSEVPSTVPVYVFVRIPFTTKGLSFSPQPVMGEAVKKPYTVSQELLRQWTEVRAPNETISGRGISPSRQTYAIPKPRRRRLTRRCMLVAKL
jgi:hypothetical protein